MNIRTTLILGLLLAGALAFLLIVNSGSPDDPAGKSNQARRDGGPKLLDVNSADVTKVVIRPGAAGGKAVELTKSADGGEWNLVQPVATRADSMEASGLVSGVLNLKPRGSVELDKANKASTGLDNPRYHIELTGKDGKTHTLAVGNRSPLGNDLYVSVGGDDDTARLVPGGSLAEKLSEGTEKLAASLRDKDLVRAVQADVNQVEITARGGKKVVLRKEDTEWKMTEPAKVDADEGEVSSLL